MESKNVKIIDEHNIDRDANVICSVDVDGSDYVIYSISRDADNDNIFVSKLIKNNDGTSNMLNIEDSIEKTKLNTIVKELITYAINNNDERTSGTVSLSDGKSVKISTVLFNKEQNINIAKTYITTVKKSVTKVSDIFYKVDVVKPDATPVVESIFDDAVSDVQSSTIPVDVPVVPEASASASVPTEPSLPNPEVSVQAPTPVVEQPAPTPVEPVMPDLTVSVQETTPAQPVVEQPTVVPTEPVLPNQVAQAPASVPPVVEPSVATPVEPVLPNLTTPVQETTPAQPAVAPTEPVLPNPAAQAPSSVPPVAEPALSDNAANYSTIVFDASKETNLNNALGEVSKANTFAASDVQAIKEFGVDEPVSQPAVAPAINNEIPNQGNTSGFANNKFFMVIAITFFIAACVFLGYEVFRYFSIVG